MRVKYTTLVWSLSGLYLVCLLSTHNQSFFSISNIYSVQLHHYLLCRLMLLSRVEIRRACFATFGQYAF